MFSSGNLKSFNSFCIAHAQLRFFFVTGLPHIQGIKGNSRNFQVEENHWETKRSIDFSINFKEVLRFEKSQENFSGSVNEI